MFTKPHMYQLVLFTVVELLLKVLSNNFLTRLFVSPEIPGQGQSLRISRFNKRNCVRVKEYEL